MINFRFHLVSLIAVFLALGLGILVGSSVVDQVIVDRLHSDINDAKHDVSQANARISQLNDDLGKTQDALVGLAPFAVSGRLQGVPIALVVDKGVDGGEMRALLSMLRTAGAEVPGVLWLDDAWRLDSPKDLTTLEATVGVTGNNEAARAASLRLLAQRLAGLPTSTKRRGRDVIEPLRGAGFLDFSDGDKRALASFPNGLARVLVVTGTDSHLSGNDTLVDLVEALVAAKVPTVVAEAFDDRHGAPPVPQRGLSVAPVRGDPTLAKEVSTIDDVETVQGEIGAALALEEIGDGTVGHYGYGQLARDGPLPTPPS